MSSDYSVTHLSGSDPTLTLPHKGGGDSRAPSKSSLPLRWGRARVGVTPVQPAIRPRRDRGTSDVPPAYTCRSDRKSVVSGKGVSVRVDLGGRRSIHTHTPIGKQENKYTRI